MVSAGHSISPYCAYQSGDCSLYKQHALPQHLVMWPGSVNYPLIQDTLASIALPYENPNMCRTAVIMPKFDQNHDNGVIIAIQLFSLS